MTPDALRALLQAVVDGTVSVEDALRRVTHAPYQELGFAKVDTHRALVQGAAEVIYGEGKRADEVARIAQALLERGQNVVVTRADAATAAALCALAPDARYVERGRVLSVVRTAPPRLGSAALVCAGTSDLPVLEECAAVCGAWGIEVERFVDVGVAGLHRLLAVREAIDARDVVIVVAGMEGALPSVVGGLTKKPVIAVPTSVGYGTNLGGLTTLFAMLSGCSSGVVVVNVDNGFGAAAAARRMLAR
ncbi:MAG: nickel pincer cofactor biosynthesis protein LarB [Deltaproteobacteria bacterium]|nr:nickel pincer cofactor biosynthesis protein LarB [Deltaproteobacteria bacterium]